MHALNLCFHVDHEKKLSLQDWLSPVIAKPLIISIGLMIFQQLSLESLLWFLILQASLQLQAFQTANLLAFQLVHHNNTYSNLLICVTLSSVNLNFSRLNI